MKLGNSELIKLFRPGRDDAINVFGEARWASAGLRITGSERLRVKESIKFSQ
jgi:hypothetical protein